MRKEINESDFFKSVSWRFDPTVREREKDKEKIKEKENEKEERERVLFSVGVRLGSKIMHYYLLLRVIRD